MCSLNAQMCYSHQKHFTSSYISNSSVPRVVLDKRPLNSCVYVTYLNTDELGNESVSKIIIND